LKKSLPYSEKVLVRKDKRKLCVLKWWKVSLGVFSKRRETMDYGVKRFADKLPARRGEGVIKLRKGERFRWG